MKINTRTMELKSSSYEIGTYLGEQDALIPLLKEIYTSGFKGFDKAEANKAYTLFKTWCPGLNEELGLCIIRLRILRW